MINQRERYKNLTQESSALLADPSQLNFPSVFNEYLRILNEINFGNFCPYIMTDPIQIASTIFLNN